MKDNEINDESFELPELDLDEILYEDEHEQEENEEENTDEEDLFGDLDNALGHQVMEEMDEYGEQDFEDTEEEMEEKPKKKHRALKITGIIMGVLLLFVLWVVATPSGRRFGLGLVAKYIHGNMTTEENNSGSLAEIDKNPGSTMPELIIVDHGSTPTPVPDHSETVNIKEPRSEEYVTTYLIFGIEEINGAANTDAMLLVSINTKDSTIKITSLLRDTYVEIPGYYGNKLNSVYAKGAKGASTTAEARKNGAALLIKVIENTYDIKIDGYACVNFNGFETIVDRLGGIDLELGSAEAEYLNKTNYISNPAYRNVKSGWNRLNGNQVLGYVRVRKVATLGGANNDYGRTLRQRRVINAIINKYKSSSIIDMISIMTDCLSVVYTNLTEQQITDALVNVVEHSIFSTASMRLPTDELFYDAGKTGIYNGNKNITYALVIDAYREENIKKFHQFVFLDPATDTTE